MQHRRFGSREESCPERWLWTMRERGCGKCAGFDSSLDMEMPAFQMRNVESYHVTSAESFEEHLPYGAALEPDLCHRSLV